MYKLPACWKIYSWRLNIIIYTIRNVCCILIFFFICWQLIFVNMADCKKKQLNKNLCSVSVNKFLIDIYNLKHDCLHLICLECNKKTSLLATFESGCKRCIEFVVDLVFMMCACNIPFYTFAKRPFRTFWEKYNPFWPFLTNAV